MGGAARPLFRVWEHEVVRHAGPSGVPAVWSCAGLTNGRLAQRESAALTRRRS